MHVNYNTKTCSVCSAVMASLRKHTQSCCVLTHRAPQAFTSPCSYYCSEYVAQAICMCFRYMETSSLSPQYSINFIHYDWKRLLHHAADTLGSTSAIKSLISSWDRIPSLGTTVFIQEFSILTVGLVPSLFRRMPLEVERAELGLSCSNASKWNICYDS